MPKEQDVAAVLRLLTDEEAQNALLPPFLRDKIHAAPAVDMLAEASGEFGFCPENPIPVNGPLGELAYLAALERVQTRQRLFYHRLGSLGPLDAFETVSADGQHWDILYFSMWHPRRSNLVPEGYMLGLGPDHAPLWWGTTGFVEPFPGGVYEAVVKASSAFLGLPLAQAAMRKALETTHFVRPQEHATRIAELLPTLARSGASLN